MKLVEVRANLLEDRVIGGYKVDYRVATDFKTYSISRIFPYEKLHIESLYDLVMSDIVAAIKDRLVEDHRP